MKIVKEYNSEHTKIRIHDDYLHYDKQNTKEVIISLVLNYLNNNHIDDRWIGGTIELFRYDCF